MKNKLAALLILVGLGLFQSSAFSGVLFSVRVAPPVIAVFDQPACPGDGYIWTPGYYQYGDYGYYWVPGAWVLPPSPGSLWTPGYWDRNGGQYLWHAGYWGPTVGFYGGINYGHGYFGSGFGGGRWEGGVFRYNAAVMNVNHGVVRNTYIDKSVVREVKGPNHAFNGKGGIRAKPSSGEVQAGRAPHQGATKEQVTHAQEAHSNHLAAHGAPNR